MSKAIVYTDFTFPGQKSVYKGKVRDVYNINDEYLAMIVSDRISAFDVVLPKGIPYKGQVLNQIAAKFLDATSDIVPNWKIATPDPMVTVGHLCEPFKVEMVIRGYLTSHAWSQYREGKRLLCGVAMPEGIKRTKNSRNPLLPPPPRHRKGMTKTFQEKKLSIKELCRKMIISSSKNTPIRSFNVVPKWQPKRD